MWHRALVRYRCQVRTLRTYTSSPGTHAAPLYNLPDSTQRAQANLRSRSDTNCSSWKLLASGLCNSSAAWSASAPEKPPNPEIPGSGFKPATPSNKACPENPAGWGDPLQELAGSSQGTIEASGQSPTSSGTEDRQPGSNPGVPQDRSESQHIPPPSSDDLKSWAAQDIPGAPPQHQMPGVPGDLIPPGIPPQLPQEPASEVPPAVDPDRVLSQGTMASDEGPSGTDLPEAGGYWAGRVPGVPVAHPADKSNR